MSRARDDARAFALSLPETSEDQPWGEDVVKVRGKVFVFLGTAASRRMTVKLVESHAHALSIDGAEPTGYGLGKAGWVTVPLTAKGVGKTLRPRLDRGELPHRRAEAPRRAARHVRRLLLAIGVLLAVASLFGSGAATPRAPHSWTLAQATRQLAATRPFAIVDRTQADEPRFVVDAASIPASRVRSRRTAPHERQDEDVAELPVRRPR